MVSKEIKHRFLISVFLATITFLLGLSLGYILSEFLINNLFIDYEKTKIKVESAYLLSLYTHHCDKESVNILSRELDFIGNYIETLFNTPQIFKDIERIKLLKSNYFNLEYTHMYLVKNYNKECNASYYIILYFYNNNIKCKYCDFVSEQLLHLKAKYPNKVMIYSFDISYPNLFIKYYINKYNITTVPFIILETPSGKIYTYLNNVTYQQLEKNIK